MSDAELDQLIVDLVRISRIEWAPSLLITTIKLGCNEYESRILQRLWRLFDHGILEFTRNRVVAFVTVGPSA